MRLFKEQEKGVTPGKFFERNLRRVTPKKHFYEIE
jgi:hypothetical protein